MTEEIRWTWRKAAGVVCMAAVTPTPSVWQAANCSLLSWGDRNGVLACLKSVLFSTSAMNFKSRRYFCQWSFLYECIKAWVMMPWVNNHHLGTFFYCCSKLNPLYEKSFNFFFIVDSFYPIHSNTIFFFTAFLLIYFTFHFDQLCFMFWNFFLSMTIN